LPATLRLHFAHRHLALTQVRVFSATTGTSASATC
jgi:hypothetical protein